MTDFSERIDAATAAAWILGHARRTGVPALPEALGRKTADECGAEELDKIVGAASEAGLKLYPFKRTTRELQRVRRVLGFLRSVPFDSLLDVGSGRGVFLIPFLNAFPGVSVTALDLLEKRVTFLNELAAGGFPNLRAERKDICEQPFPARSFDVVSLLEVLEHIPAVDAAIAAALRMARKFVVVTVPSKPDDNPEHIHLLTRDRLTSLFNAAGCSRLRFDGVEGHLILIASVGAG